MQDENKDKAAATKAHAFHGDASRQSEAATDSSAGSERRIAAHINAEDMDVVVGEQKWPAHSLSYLAFANHQAAGAGNGIDPGECENSRCRASHGVLSSLYCCTILLQLSSSFQTVSLFFPWQMEA